MARMLSRIDAPCKINLGLRVLGLRSDGYHEIESFFYPLDYPCDTLLFRESAAGNFSLSFDAAGIDPQNNTMSKAYRLFADACPELPGLELVVQKRIPQGAGLGGGSSDAASLLLWLNKRVPRPLCAKKLSQIAAEVGADVPFFLNPRPSLVCGIGEKIQARPFCGKGLWLVLCCPKQGISTAWAFAAFDRLKRQQKSLTKRPLTDNGFALKEQDNDLAHAVFAAYPELSELRERLLAFGASTASMSGSGSSIYGIFRSEARAKKAAWDLRSKVQHCYFLPMKDYS